MISCMSRVQLEKFVSLLGDIVTRIGDNSETVIIHAAVGDVVWQWNGELYCIVEMFLG